MSTPATQKLRWIVWSILIITLLAAALAYGQVTTAYDAAGIPRVWLFAIMGICGVSSIFVSPITRGKALIATVLIPAVVARLLLLPTAPSDDVNRYLWEGKLVAKGINPYNVVADDPSRIYLRDQYWEKMNHKDKPTAYPTLSLFTFSWINSIGYDPMSYKIVFGLLDIVLIIALIYLLRLYRLPLKWASFYALSPLTMISFAAEGHFDILMVLPFVLALITHKKQWIFLTGACMGLAVGFKIILLILVPLFLWGKWKHQAIGYTGFFLALAIPLIPYWNNISSIIYALLVFGSSGSFNSGSFQLLQLISGDISYLPKLITALLYITAWGGAFWMCTQKQTLTAIKIALGSLIILSPTLHFWYLTWILPLIALKPRISWVSLSITSCLYFLVWSEQSLGNGWQLPTWSKWAFWAVFYPLVIWESIPMFKKIIYLKKSSSRSKNQAHSESNDLNNGEYSNKPSLSIIIPTYQAEDKIQTCIQSITDQAVTPLEVIIIDAQSHDNTRDIITSLKTLYPIEIIDSELGRGKQIQTGVLAATGDWIVILHADATLDTDVLHTLLETIKVSPHMTSGCFGQVFDRSSTGKLLIESLNDFRATLLETSFGDQTQFFHRTTALENNILTDQPLMEDVEMSDRLKSCGDQTNLHSPSTVSASKWKSESFLKRFITIVRFFAHYRILTFSAKKRKALSEALYREYYQ